jgi:pyroglutamyl-peptidase
LPTCSGADAVHILLIGFGPFPGAPFNPSAALVKALARRRRPILADTVRTTHVLATTYAAVDRDLPGLFAEQPDIVLMFGLAGRRRHVSVETRARNAASVLFPDASGQRPPRNVIALGGPRARYGAAPTAYLLAALRACSVPARLSRDAGRYLCNYAYWRALERAHGGHPLVQFIHIPPLRFDARPRRRLGRRRPLSLALLVPAAEKLLVALITASRR